MEHTFSNVPERRDSKKLNLETFTRYMAGYSVMMTVIFASVAMFGSISLHPTRLTPVVCLVMAVICAYAAYQEGQFSGTFAGVLGMTIFLGLAVGATAALFKRPEILVVVMVTAVAIVIVAATGMVDPAVFWSWRLVAVAQVTLIVLSMFWEFTGPAAERSGFPYVEMSLGWWAGSVACMFLMIVIWRAALDDGEGYYNHENALLAGGGGILYVVVGIVLSFRKFLKEVGRDGWDSD